MLKLQDKTLFINWKSFFFRMTIHLFVWF